MRITVAFALILLLSASGCKKSTTVCLTCPPLPTDSTSHNFSWTLQHFGDGASSSFNDVAIINDSLAYAVGEVRIRDSVGG